jgi:ion channel-forming bestrophin family protein
MHAGRHYTIKEVLFWTRREVVVFAAIAFVPCVFAWAGIESAVLPWPPLAVLGTAVAFMTGFKGNAAYNRVWEARQIWGGIVNASRAWAIMVRDFVCTPEADAALHTRLLLRHVAWLTALRHQLREPRAWETQGLRHNLEFQARTFKIPEQSSKLEDDLLPLLAAAEVPDVMQKKNRACALLALQSDELRRCVEAGRITEFRHVELVRMITTLYDLQGRCERIKNFPYPRQYATLNMFFVWMFITALPFGLAAELKRVGHPTLWLTIPITVIIAWVFHTMDKIADSTENPFEGGPNDVPITAMTRAIEIDMRDFLNQRELPEPCKPFGNILM